ncbi:hypothetical protein FCULG_00011075 [Fusarium culmorum]|uniref:Uncharacterized protein n=1 Tax=Fusarium culmorum TaxID=5516 RepID=A0A2T4GZC3_FUSCU|nr:hypothetical protein FCULG_00011075 [Fusarium culmorum]
MSFHTFSDFECGDSIPDDDWEYTVPPPPPTPVSASRQKRGKGCPPPKSQFLHANLARRQEITKGSRPQTPRPRRDGPFSSIWHGMLVLPHSETCSPLKGVTLVVLTHLRAAIVMSDLRKNVKSRGRTKMRRGPAGTPLSYGYSIMLALRAYS